MAERAHGRQEDLATLHTLASSALDRRSETTPVTPAPLATREHGQPDDEVRLRSSALPDTTQLLGFRGDERVSAPYRFEILVSTPSEMDVDMSAIVGTRVTTVVNARAREALEHHGVVAAVEQVDGDRERDVYRLVMVPELWHLDHSVHSRVFTEVSLPAILTTLLELGGVDATLDLRESYEELDHVCQYRESDLAFISRLMEREGLFYYFDHSGQAERMVIADHPSTHPEHERPVRFLDWDEQGNGAGLDRLRCHVRAVPARVQLADYDPLNPGLDLRGQAVVSAGRGDIVLYGENLRNPGGGARLARVRAEELAVDQTAYQADGNELGVVAGQVVAVEDHPRASFNRRYLVTSVTHHAVVSSDAIVSRLLDPPRDETYRVTLTAIPAEVPYRAPRVTPWPRIDGVVDGIVDGASGSEYAQVDDHGRYKVRIFFDESDPVDGSGSTWVRMLQPHGGGTEGMHFPLRKDTEVLMVFLGGDPDRPVIVGTAPNAHKPSKITSGNNTLNRLVSGAANELVMDDASGAERVQMSTPNNDSFLHMGAGADNFVVSTGGNGREHVGGNRGGFIGGTFDETIGGAATQSFGATYERSVAGATTETLASTLDQSVTGAVTQSYAATHALAVTGAASRDYAASLGISVASTLDQSVAGAATESFAATLDTSIAGAYSLTVGGSVSEAIHADATTTVAGSHTLSASGAQVIESLADQTVHGASQTFVSDGTQILSSADHTVETSTSTTNAATIVLNGSGAVAVAAPEVGISAATVGIAAGDVSVDGGTVTITGGGAVHVSAGTIHLN